MYAAALLALLTPMAMGQVLKGYNYGALNPDASPRVQSQWEAAFDTAKNVQGAPGFTSARLFTTVQAGTANAPIEAIPAAISTGTSLLLGMWSSAGDASFENELVALRNAINQYGTAFTDLVKGISVGSEDLYRISPDGLGNLSGPGVGPAVLVAYIARVKALIRGTPLEGRQVGHVDTWSAFVNASNIDVVSASDFLGVDAYPYYEVGNSNDISNAGALFSSAYSQVVAIAQGKPVWIAETGWPTSGDTKAQAVPSVENARTYWNAVGCRLLFDKINTWWFTLQDPQFGVVGNSLSTIPLYDLSCAATR